MGWAKGGITHQGQVFAPWPGSSAASAVAQPRRTWRAPHRKGDELRCRARKPDLLWPRHEVPARPPVAGRDSPFGCLKRDLPHEIVKIHLEPTLCGHGRAKLAEQMLGYKVSYPRGNPPETHTDTSSGKPTKISVSLETSSKNEAIMTQKCEFRLKHPSKMKPSYNKMCFSHETSFKNEAIMTQNERFA